MDVWGNEAPVDEDGRLVVFVSEFEDWPARDEGGVLDSTDGSADCVFEE